MFNFVRICLSVNLLLIVCHPVHADNMPSKPLDTDEVLRQAMVSASAAYRTVAGLYVSRTTNPPTTESDEKTKAHLEEVRKTIRKQNAEQAERIRKAGGVPNMVKYETNMEATLAELKSKSGSSTTTEICRYAIDGPKVRLERLKVSDEASLDEIKDMFLNKKIDMSNSTVSVWNGIETMHIIRDGNKSDGASRKNTAVMSQTNEVAIPVILTFGKIIPEKGNVIDALNQLRNAKFPIVATEKTEMGSDRTVKLQIGEPNNVALEMTLVLLPDKGYLAQSSIVKAKTVLSLREICEDFYKTSAGFWVPLKGTRESYKASPQGVVSLATRFSFATIEAPVYDANIPNATFDIRNDRLFTEAKFMENRTETPGIGDENKISDSSSRWRRYLYGIIPLIILVIVFTIHKRRLKIAG